MSKKVVSIDKMAETIAGEISLYTHALSDDVVAVAEDVAKKCLEEVRAKSPVRKGPYGGGYRAGWTIKKISRDKTGFPGAIYKIYNKTHYRLTHLLEKGHALRNGGRSEAFPHIRPAEQAASKMLTDEIKQLIGEFNI